MTQEIFTESLAEWIRASRKQLRMTQLHLAMAVGVRRSTVTAWERGTRQVSAFHHARLTACFKGGGVRVKQ